MGVSKDGVVMNLAWVAGWVVEKLHGLVAAMARVEGILMLIIKQTLQNCKKAAM